MTTYFSSVNRDVLRFLLEYITPENFDATCASDPNLLKLCLDPQVYSAYIDSQLQYEKISNSISYVSVETTLEKITCYFLWAPLLYP